MTMILMKKAIENEINSKTILSGIEEGLIKREDYIGLDFDTSKIRVDERGFVEQMNNVGDTLRITKEKAIRLVEQGGAYIESPSVIRSMINKVTKDLSLKNYIMERDNHTCHYCNEEGDTLDHVIPQFHGGLDTPLNLVCCCRKCNFEKGNMSKKDFIRFKSFGLLLNSLNNETKKKCTACERVFDGFYFEKQENICKLCYPYQHFVELGVISQKELNEFILLPSILTTAYIQVESKENVVLGFFKKNDVLFFIKKGIMRLISDYEAILTIDLSYLQEYDPVLFREFENIHNFNYVELIDIQKREGLELLRTPVIFCYDIHQNKTRINKNKAVSLVSSGLAVILRENTIQILSDNNKNKKVAAKLKKEGPLKSEEVAYYNIEGKEIGNGEIPRCEAEKLLDRGYAMIRGEDEIRLIKPLKFVESEMPYLKVYSNCDENVKETPQSRMKKQLKELQTNLILCSCIVQSRVINTEIDKEMAKKLIREGCAVVVKKNQIHLTRKIDYILLKLSAFKDYANKIKEEQKEEKKLYAKDIVDGRADIIDINNEKMSNCYIFANHVKVLVDSNYAEIINEEEIRLLRTVDFVRNEHPNFIKIKENGD